MKRKRKERAERNPEEALNQPENATSEKKQLEPVSTRVCVAEGGKTQPHPLKLAGSTTGWSPASLTFRFAAYFTTFIYFRQDRRGKKVVKS